MIKANPTIFKFYLAIMDSFSEYLSHKYSDKSLENPNHYKTIIIRKIIRMFHTLVKLTQETQDEVSARCVLRGILDSVTVYCFIYEREDKYDMMFRHYLYALDGFITYKKGIIDKIMEDGENKFKFECAYNEVIRQIENKLSSHPYQKLNNKNVKTIINNANWKYKSLDKPRGMTFNGMYKQVGYDASLTDYYKDILSQYAHGLCISNTQHNNHERLQNVLYESIPIADRMILSICNTFLKKELLLHINHSEIIKRLVKEPEFNIEDLFSFVNALIRKDKILII
jgi:hypothetical protein